MNLKVNHCYYIEDSEGPFLIVKTIKTHREFNGRKTIDWINYLRESNILQIFFKGIEEKGIYNSWEYRFKITEIQENEIPHYVIMSVFIAYNKRFAIR